MSNDYATRADVRQLGEDIVDRVFERMDAEKQDVRTMHGENQSMMREIRDEAKRTNGRVTKLEALYGILADEFQAIRKRWHDFRDSVQEVITKHVLDGHPKNGLGELSPVTRLDAKSAVGIFILGMTAFYTLMRLLGKV